MANEQEEFLKDIKSEESEDPFAEFNKQAEKPADEPEKKSEDKGDVDPEDVEESLKNRRHKRLEEKLRLEREGNIELNKRVQTLASELDNFKKFSNSEPTGDIHSILYGSEAPTPETRATAERMQKLLSGLKNEAKEEAIREFQARQEQRQRELEKEERQLDEMVENLEEDYNVMLTKEQRQSYFKLMEKMSPKDESGEVIAYADPDAVWEVFQEKLNKKPVNPAKALASRSSAQGSSANSEQKMSEDAAERWLREKGII